jgi:hypothetical protein
MQRPSKKQPAVDPWTDLGSPSSTGHANAKAMAASTKLGPTALIAMPVLAGSIAADNALADSRRRGHSETAGRVRAAAVGAFTGGSLAAISYGVWRGFKAASSAAESKGGLAAKAVAAAGRVFGPATLVGAAAYGAHQGYQAGGARGAINAAIATSLNYATFGASGWIANRSKVPSGSVAARQHARPGYVSAQAKAKAQQASAAASRKASRNRPTATAKTNTGGPRGFANRKTQAAAQDARRRTGYRRRKL